MWPNPHFPADMFTFTEEILNGKLHFLCSDIVVLESFENKDHSHSKNDNLFNV